MAKDPVKKGPGISKSPVDHKLLSKEDKAALREQARKSVLEELTQEARDDFFSRALAEARRASTPADQILDIFIDVAPFVPFIAIDGIQYFHGYTYQVPRNRAAVLYEQMQRSWLHQDEIDGRSRFNPYRRAQNTVLGPRNAGQQTVGANGVVSMPEDAEV
jgi:hypothetical protein